MRNQTRYQGQTPEMLQRKEKFKKPGLVKRNEVESASMC